MSEQRPPEFEALQRAALKATRGWDSAKASMAVRSAGLDCLGQPRASLDVIGADLGVSRETVRRARNELLQMIDLPFGVTSGAVYSLLSLNVPSNPSVDSPATARALRRVLTMTGRLPWDEVVSAWARAGGKPPYYLLPADVASMRIWAEEAGGFAVAASGSGAGSVTIASVLPEDLDQVSHYLLDALRGRTAGVHRSELLKSAERVGLKRTTIATTLSIHPAVKRVGRGIWALRGCHQQIANEPVHVVEPRRDARVRPTTFVWSADGSLMIEFSVPRSPSPVVAVPKAVSGIIEGREFLMDKGEKSMRFAVRNARLWGFGPLLSELKVPDGARASIALNLLAGTATITFTEGKGMSR